MNYNELYKAVEGLPIYDIYIVVAVHDNIHTSDYTEAEINKMCSIIHEIGLSYSAAHDLDLVAFWIQYLIDNGKFKKPTRECIEKAFDLAK